MFSSISETALNIAMNKRNASATGQHSQLFSLSISLPVTSQVIYISTDLKMSQISAKGQIWFR